MEFSDVPAPTAAVLEVGVAQPRIAPAQQVLFYGDAEWENFIREWVTGLTELYFQVQRVGGAGDQGVDVAAFKTADRHEGPWDCFQAKHYGRALRWSDLLPELIKVFRHASRGDYTMPDNYVLVSPRGVGASLNKLLNKPSALREKFISEAPAKLVDDPERAKVLAIASGESFTRFRAEELVDLIEVHRKTPYFASRFGEPLPGRSIDDTVPDSVQAVETRYVQHLVDAYEERWSDEFTPEIAMTDDRSRTHFQRQRIRFFQAESLRAYARDAVLPGTFERFQDVIFNGVIATVEQDHSDGYARLQAALSIAGQLTLSAHSLIAVAGQDDLKGVCHQLANEDRLKWVNPS